MKTKGGPRLVVKRTMRELEETEKTLQLTLLEHALSALDTAAAAALGASRAVTSYAERVSILGKQLEVSFHRTIPTGSEGVNVAMGAMAHMQLLLDNFKGAVDRANGKAMLLQTQTARSWETLGEAPVAKIYAEHMAETRDEKLWIYIRALALKAGVNSKAFSRCGDEAQ